MAVNYWTPMDMYPEGSSVWLMLVCDTAMKSVRTSGLPSEKSTGFLMVHVPTLKMQACAMRGNDSSVGPSLMRAKVEESQHLLERYHAYAEAGMPFTIDGINSEAEFLKAIQIAEKISTMPTTTNAYYHVHANKDVLDKFSQFKSGQPAYNNRELLTEISASYDVVTIKSGDDIPDNLREGGLIIEQK